MMLLVSPTHAIFLPFRLANGSIDLTDCSSSACVVESDVEGREGGLYASNSVNRSAKIWVG